MPDRGVTVRPAGRAGSVTWACRPCAVVPPLLVTGKVRVAEVSSPTWPSRATAPASATVTTAGGELTFTRRADSTTVVVPTASVRTPMVISPVPSTAGAVTWSRAERVATLRAGMPGTVQVHTAASEPAPHVQPPLKGAVRA